MSLRILIMIVLALALVATVVVFISGQSAEESAEESGEDTSFLSPQTGTDVDRPGPVGAAHHERAVNAQSGVADPAQPVDAPSGLATAPRIHIADPLADLGQRIAGEQVAARFAVSNRGDADLHITHIGTSCGCLVSHRSWPETLAPGASGTIALTIDTRDLGAQTRQPLTLFSNDPAQPRTTLWLAVQLQHVLRLQPTTIAFGAVEAEGLDQVAPRKLVVRNVSGADVHLSQPQLDDERFTLDLAVTEPGQLWTLTVTPVGPFGLGLHEAYLTVQCSHPRLNSLRIPLSLYVPPPIQVIPPRVTVRPQLGGRPLRRLLIVRHNADEPWEILAARCPDPQVSVTISPGTRPGMQRVSVAFPPDYEPPEGLELHLDCQRTGADSHTVSIPVPIVTAP